MAGSLDYWARMSVRLSVVLAAMIAGLGPALEAEEPARQSGKTTFRSSTTVVSVTAVVRDNKGRFVRDLQQKDFTVAESGRPKPILDFRAESDGPVKLALLFDISGSMRVSSRAVDARQAARHLLSALRSTDQAALYSFDTRLQRVRDFTSDFNSLTAAIEHVETPYGQTSLYDAVAETARAVAAGSGDHRDSAARVQRRAVVVLTDGVDTRSRLTAAEVTAIASAIDVPVYVLAVMSAVDDPRVDVSPDNGRDEESSALRNLAHWTGGELFISTAPAHASIASRRIIDELRHQYVLAFEASVQAGWHPLEVRARNRNLVVRARAGYTAGGAAGP
jgi:VWFA-related protein